MNTTTLRLRDYQEKLVTDIYGEWERCQKVMAQLPTGGGKTVVFSAISDEFTCRGLPVLVLAHREELLLQAQSKLSTVTSQPVGIIKAGYRPDYDLPIQVGSVQSVVNRLDKMPPPGLVIVDEAHHATAGTYRKILEAFPYSYQLGVTATPTRLDGTGFADLFDSLVCGPSVAELIRMGHLSQFTLFADPDAMKTSGARIQQGDYSASDIADCNNVVELSGNLIRSYREKADGKQCVVFAVNVEHSQEIARRYQANGINAVHLDGETDSAFRREALKQFANREIQVLVNCALFDEGLDIPGIEVLQCAKPTASLVRWLQMFGRALRPAPGKERAIILDHTNNWAIHGLPTRPRVWTLEGTKTTGKTRTVKDRDGVVSEVPELEVVESATPLKEVELTPEQEWANCLQDLIRTQQQRGYKKGWVQFELEKLNPPLEVWYQAAEALGYQRGWGWHKWHSLNARTA